MLQRLVEQRHERGITLDTAAHVAELSGEERRVVRARYGQRFNSGCGEARQLGVPSQVHRRPWAGETPLARQQSCCVPAGQFLQRGQMRACHVVLDVARPIPVERDRSRCVSFQGWAAGIQLRQRDDAVAERPCDVRHLGSEFAERRRCERNRPIDLVVARRGRSGQQISNGRRNVGGSAQ